MSERASPPAVRKGCAFPWSFYICDEVNDERMRTSEGRSLALAPLGERVDRRGVFISRGEKGAPRSACRGGEGVKPVKTPNPYRQTRSLARTAGPIDRARELRRTPTETERESWHLLGGLRSRGFRFRRPHPAGPYIADFCCTELRLMVELDGSVHGEPIPVRSDARCASEVDGFYR